ncbi:hypothetical protein D9758_007142 [Tetrapyrgos nigripes]|uniref:Uncharacterized protein n=1 Tax=Tetrapyrgos nigripes TaxID=182062 RepID=A0A8H5LMW4_9AGAR|nr:hypothetical protein D9758_007142 [Tetrapyrgos nigripes]
MADPQTSTAQPSTSITITTPTPVETKRCTVRGCTVEFPATLRTKMCDLCRGKHRIYATTKRAKRKMEKAAMNGLILETAEQPGQMAWSLGSAENVNGDVDKMAKKTRPKATTSKAVVSPTTPSDATNSPGTEPIASTSSSDPYPFQQQGSFQTQPLVSWDLTNIDPQLFKAQSTIRSSELAGALGPPSVSSYTHAVPAHIVTPVNGSAGAGSQTVEQPPVEPMAASSSASTADPCTPVDTSTAGASPSSGPRRYCTIRGCRVVLSGDYPFKMCEPCRVKHRQYGITKRAKFKAERAAFDKELADLRAAEDARRKEQGLPPLSESEEELRAWELSIIDEKVKLPPSLLAVLAASTASSPTSPFAVPSTGMKPIFFDKRTMVPASETLFPSATPANPDAGSGSPDGASASASSHLASYTPALPPPQSHQAFADEPTDEDGEGDDDDEENQLVVPIPVDPGPSASSGSAQGSDAVAPVPSLPQSSPPFQNGLPVLTQRMCTVSHCHTILPANYLYKRCEQHRLQNRKYSRLKWARDRVAKAKGPEEVEKNGIQIDESLVGGIELIDQEWEKVARERAGKLMLARMVESHTKEKRKRKKEDSEEALIQDGEDENETVQEKDEKGTPPPEGAEPWKRPRVVPSASGSNHYVNEKRRSFTCTNADCMNLINPDLRWRMCEPCREIRKDLRMKAQNQAEQQLRDAEKAWERLAVVPSGDMVPWNANPSETQNLVAQTSVTGEGDDSNLSNIDDDDDVTDSHDQVQNVASSSQLTPSNSNTSLTFKPYFLQKNILPGSGLGAGAGAGTAEGQVLFGVLHPAGRPVTEDSTVAEIVEGLNVVEGDMMQVNGNEAVAATGGQHSGATASESQHSPKQTSSTAAHQQGVPPSSDTTVRPTTISTLANALASAIASGSISATPGASSAGISSNDSRQSTQVGQAHSTTASIRESAAQSSNTVLSSPAHSSDTQEQPTPAFSPTASTSTLGPSYYRPRPIIPKGGLAAAAAAVQNNGQTEPAVLRKRKRDQSQKSAEANSANDSPLAAPVPEDGPPTSSEGAIAEPSTEQPKAKRKRPSRTKPKDTAPATPSTSGSTVPPRTPYPYSYPPPGYPSPYGANYYGYMPYPYPPRPQGSGEGSSSSSSSATGPSASPAAPYYPYPPYGYPGMYPGYPSYGAPSANGQSNPYSVPPPGIATSGATPQTHPPVPYPYGYPYPGAYPGYPYPYPPSAVPRPTATTPTNSAKPTAKGKGKEKEQGKEVEQDEKAASGEQQTSADGSVGASVPSSTQSGQGPPVVGSPAMQPSVSPSAAAPETATPTQGTSTSQPSGGSHATPAEGTVPSNASGSSSLVPAQLSASPWPVGSTSSPFIAPNTDLNGGGAAHQIPVQMPATIGAGSNTYSGPIMSLQRKCRIHTCNRVLPPGATGGLCEKCKTRLKKHQAKTKQRLKLEPKKPVLVAKSTNEEGQSGEGDDRQGEGTEDRDI